MISVALILLGIIWLIFMGLAISTKSKTIFLFLFFAGIFGGVIEGLFIYLGVEPLAWIGAVAIFIFMASMIRIINEYERGVLFRFGRQVLVLGPGINLIFPMGIDFVRVVDLRTFTIDVPKQEVITRDNVTILVDAVIYFNVFDPALAIVKVADYVRSTSLLGQTILRSVLGQHELDEMLSKRTELNLVLKELLDVATDPWGMKVTAVEIKAVELAETMKRAIAKQAEAERERRAKVIAADGELQASEKLSQAAHVLNTEPVSVQLRYLQTLTEIAVEKNSTILFPIPLDLSSYIKLNKDQEK
jgi:regulator of protease activity HflC (stomatin/prohibitin superfamily)